MKLAEEAGDKITLLVITSPTYEGLSAKIVEIGHYCSDKKIKILADEAHGALFHFKK